MKAIKIFGRGRNRDEFGNPYWSAVAVVEKDEDTYLFIAYPFIWGSSSADNVFSAVRNTLNNSGIEVSNEIDYEYKHATKDCQLERPLAWLPVKAEMTKYSKVETEITKHVYQ